MKPLLAVGFRRLASLLERTDPVRLVVLGYASYMLAGWVLLCLPWSTKVPGASALDHLFTAVSAVSTTGLATVTAGETYSGFGQVVILALIQLGGLGYMTFGSFAVLAATGRLTPLRERIGTAALGLPAGFDLASFLRVIVVFTLAIEAAGAVALYPRFVAHGAPWPAWQAAFHSVSAFCTAGFGLYADSFESFRADWFLNVVIAALSYVGAIGFIVVNDVWSSWRCRERRVTLTSKIIVLSTVWIGAAGTVLFLLDEPSLQGLPAAERWMVAAFQVMTASTTVGFNTVPIGGLAPGPVFLLTVVMLIGASPAGTGGGIKTTTITALWAEMMAVLRRRSRVEFLGRAIPAHRLRGATANILFYCLALAAGLYALLLVEKASFADLLFECASAIGTVGLSRGVTGDLTAAGKLIVIGLMFVGRAGPTVLGMALLPAAAPPAAEPVRAEDVVI